MMNKEGYTLVEIIVVAGLIGILFSAFLGVLLNSETFWNKGQSKITEQYEARLAMGMMVNDLRESNTYWGITIGSNQILFYKPRFDDSGNLNGTYWVGYKLNPYNFHYQLVRKKQGDTVYTNVTNPIIESLSFAGSTDGCQTFDNSTVSTDCPRIRITITTKKEQNFTLTTDVVLRNQYTALAGDPPEEGEF